jgi:hypothetical protein
VVRWKKGKKLEAVLKKRIFVGSGSGSGPCLKAESCLNGPGSAIQQIFYNLFLAYK